ncbi:MAG: hypothetical protein CVU38_02810 [Chloroflexi bacterium HGW-Chloroflexi-1]|nr:MAG: hypothetical protein CVU38_02810 [Chloroflexi bacterium HGW-Chloroflexi-1]
MTTVALQSQLVEQLEDVAAERRVRSGDLLETAVRVYLRQVEQEKIRTEASAFRAMHDRLAKEYLAKYVAIHNGAVVDHDEDFQALHARVRQKYGRQPVLLRRVEPEPERVLTFRSPSVEPGRL